MRQVVSHLVRVTDANPRILALVHNLTDSAEDDLLRAGVQDVLSLSSPLSRIRARLLAHQRQAMKAYAAELVLTRGPLTIHVGRREVHLDGKLITLTKAEFDLLIVLAARPRQVLSRSELMDSSSDRRSDRSLESHLSRLRSKLVRHGGPRLIEPVRGVGYRFGTLNDRAAC